MFSARNCSYRFPGTDHWAFRSVDFDIAKGEVVLLRGRNGSGKSTLLKLICGMLEPTEGQRNINSDVRPIYMDQSANDMLAPQLTVLEQLRAFRVESSSPKSIGGSLHEFGLGLEMRLEEFVGHLSGGQRQIIALLATIEAGANLLCLDEFLSALDMQSANVVTKLIERFVSTGEISVVAVSHSPVGLRVDREVCLDTALLASR